MSIYAVRTWSKVIYRNFNTKKVRTAKQKRAFAKKPCLETLGTFSTTKEKRGKRIHRSDFYESGSVLTRAHLASSICSLLSSLVS